MNTPTAPTIRRLLGNLFPFLLLLAIALVLFALASWMETPATARFQLLGWLQGLEHSYLKGPDTSTPTFSHCLSLCGGSP